MNRITLLTALTAVLAAPLAGCGLSTEGENRLARFQWDDPTAPLGASLDQAVAVGTTARLDVQAIDATPDFRVRGAKVEPPEIARVTAAPNELNVLLVEGLESGTAELIITTDAGEDITTIRVAAPADTVVSSQTGTDKVLVGGVETLLIERREITGAKLVGVAPAELEIKPEGVAERVEGGVESEFRLRYLTEGGKTIEIGDGSLSREIVTTDDVMRFDFAEGLQRATLKAGESQPGVIQALDAADELIGALEGAVEITNETPEICTATVQHRLFLPALVVQAHTAGACVIGGQLGTHEARIELTVE